VNDKEETVQNVELEFINAKEALNELTPKCPTKNRDPTVEFFLSVRPLTFLEAF